MATGFEIRSGRSSMLAAVFITKCRNDSLNIFLGDVFEIEMMSVRIYEVIIWQLGWSIISSGIIYNFGHGFIKVIRYV